MFGPCFIMQFYCLFYSKTCINGHSQRPKIGFKDQFPLNAGQKHCRMIICVKQPLSKSPKLVFKTNYRLMQVTSIA